MKLTPEQQRYLFNQVGKTTNGEQTAFLAGCRYQHQITLERAAKVCDAYAAEPESNGYGPADCASSIRALPYEDDEQEKPR